MLQNTTIKFLKDLKKIITNPGLIKTEKAMSRQRQILPHWYKR
jgi:hypothetical protein